MIVVCKKFLSVVVTLALLVCFMRGTASASGIGNLVQEELNHDVGILWEHTTYVFADLSIDDGKATCTGTVIGNSGTTQITGTAILSLKNTDGTYTPIKTWDGLSATGSRLSFSKSHYVSKGYTYRLTVTATVYRNGGAEALTNSHEVFF